MKAKNSKYKLNTKYRNKTKKSFLKTERQLGRREPSRDFVQPKYLRFLIQF